MPNSYDPNSLNAVLSRIETEIKEFKHLVSDFVQQQKEKEAAQDKLINKLWARMNKLDVRVAGIAAGVALIGEAVKLHFGK